MAGGENFCHLEKVAGNFLLRIESRGKTGG